ncbi:MAG: mechanosensitive ion channel family protein [Clostridia bacterium]|nr:mechanosensitive ion channel family protein [Clostridia bacterium]
MIVAKIDWSAILNNLINLAQSVGLKLLAGILVLVVGLKLVKWIVKRLEKSKGFSKLEGAAKSFLISLIKIVLNVLVLVTAMSIFGIPMTSFVTIIATAGAAVGLALQGSLSNFAGGLMLLIFKPFRVGDFIESNGASGTVTDISIIYTTLLTPDNKKVTLPNGNLTNSVVVNYSSEETRRVDLSFSVAYDTDIEKVKDILLKAAKGHSLVLADPEPFSRLSQQGDSALVFALRVWTKNSDYWQVNFDLNEQIKKTFDEQGIVIPYQQIDVHIAGSGSEKN